ncbi:uncharacterized protein LOC132631306 [Lycium barbarum]|uniref:uncharacterized protein LOC132631306 n=1 Tax=Lycium barbarum TaxID=112863 RepID=UPI00293F3DE5|nr:uncharacterized protein LOC132631306 [Lycium barbarum]
MNTGVFIREEEVMILDSGWAWFYSNLGLFEAGLLHSSQKAGRAKMSSAQSFIFALTRSGYSGLLIMSMEDKEQQVLLHISQAQGTFAFYVTVVYAKCDENLRVVLWDELRDSAGRINGPWGVVGDFNVSTSPKEKVGGSHIGWWFLWAPFTWSDNRDPPNTIWKRLDRLAYNEEWFDLFGGTTVTHLSRTCSDHAPLLIKCGIPVNDHISYFKFLKMWVKHEDHLNIIQQSWSKEVQGNSLYVLPQKTKKVCKTLSVWSRSTFGDIYEKLMRLEKLIKDLEDEATINDNQEIRTKISCAKAEFNNFLKLQDSVLKQKARIKWLTERDANTAYFHGVIKYRRKKISILKIKNDEGTWVEGTNDVAGAAVQFFQKLFSAENTIEDSQVLSVVKKVVSDADNETLTAIPTLQKVKNSTFSIKPDSAPGPDGLSAKFYQNAWNIIGYDVHKAVKAFFNGATLPRFITHTCLIMLPKVNSPQQFSDIRPISLCNVFSKIIAKLINARLSTILPRIISLNQSELSPLIKVALSREGI